MTSSPTGSHFGRSAAAAAAEGGEHSHRSGRVRYMEGRRDMASSIPDSQPLLLPSGSTGVWHSAARTIDGLEHVSGGTSVGS